MFTRIRYALGFALLLSLVLVIPVFAGGWAVITLDELPTNVVAGEPLTIGFVVLQHGRTPLDGLTPTITANLYKDQEFVVQAEPGGKPGHYTATLIFPSAGEWRWSIQAFTMDQTMPMLSVAPATTTLVKEPIAKPEPVTSPVMPIILFSGLAFAITLVSVLIAYRRKSRMILVFSVLCLLAGVALFIIGTGRASLVEAQADSDVAVSANSTESQVELGRQLFIAKGCITCHYNSRAASPSDYLTIEMGAPNLSKFSASPEIIRMRLKDPSSVKSDTKMSQLYLSESEIEALVTFINSH